MVPWTKRCSGCTMRPNRATHSYNPRPAHHEHETGLNQFFKAGRTLACRVAPVVQQVMVQINFDGTGFGAGAAQGRGLRQMFPILKPAQMRCDDRANRPLISRAVTVTADVFENRANIQTGAATDAVQRVTLFGVRQQFRAAVVQQHDVKLLRAVGFARLSRPAIKRVVAGDGLPRARRRQHGQEQGEVGKSGQNLFNPDNRHVHFRQRSGQPGIAFIFRDGNHARFGDGKVRAADAHVRLDSIFGA